MYKPITKGIRLMPIDPIERTELTRLKLDSNSTIPITNAISPRIEILPMMFMFSP